MADLAPSQTVWQARTGAAAARVMQTFSDSTEEDQALVTVDLAGSIAHVLGLHQAGLIGQGEAATLIDGLQSLFQEHQAGTLTLDPGLEDVHMNVEHQLGELAGPVAGKLHTGRSRNDQVALDLVLHTRLGLAHLAGSTLQLATTLLDQAQAHVETPWVARTHGQPAQPATLGFLFHAHALRYLALTRQALALFDEHDQSPLGSGAVAGSTLPLDPALTADLLGLSPPDNALLATSSRDGTLATCQLVARIGQAVASLAQELIDLADQGAIELPPGFTTGSSLMPHKTNPDALELARAHGKALAIPAQQVQSLLAGLPLGYHRDLQLAKPPLLQALDETPPLLTIVTEVVAGLTVDETVLADQLSTPGIGATDAVEALVATGLPFRDAYHALATAEAARADGDSPQAALEAQGLGPQAVQAALDAALQPDPAKRTTLGGPAPTMLAPAIESAQDRAGELATAVAQAEDEASVPITLLTTPSKRLIAQLEEGA